MPIIHPYCRRFCESSYSSIQPGGPFIYHRDQGERMSKHIKPSSAYSPRSPPNKNDVGRKIRQSWRTHLAAFSPSIWSSWTHERYVVLHYSECVELILMGQAFESILDIRLRHLPGHRKIKQYTLRANALNRDLNVSIDIRNSFLPG